MHLGPPIRPSLEPKPGEVIYRIYFFDGQDHISTSNEFFARTDQEAMKKAEAWGEGGKMELWQRDRMVSRWG